MQHKTPLKAQRRASTYAEDTARPIDKSIKRSVIRFYRSIGTRMKNFSSPSRGMLRSSRILGDSDSPGALAARCDPRVSAIKRENLLSGYRNGAFHLIRSSGPASPITVSHDTLFLGLSGGFIHRAAPQRSIAYRSETSSCIIPPAITPSRKRRRDRRVGRRATRARQETLFFTFRIPHRR